MWNDLPNTVFDSGTLDIAGVRCWWHPDLCCLQSPVSQVLVGLQNQFINKFSFHNWACSAGFNNNNNNSNLYIYFS